MPKTARPNTPNRGAADDRARIKAHIQVLLGRWKSSGGFVHVASFAQELTEFIDTMKVRNATRKGGLGKR